MNPGSSQNGGIRKKPTLEHNQSTKAEVEKIENQWKKSKSQNLAFHRYNCGNILAIRTFMKHLIQFDCSNEFHVTSAKFWNPNYWPINACSKEEWQITIH